MNPSIAVFDIGHVLIQWDPRHLYRQIFDDPERMEWFLANICTTEWNRACDGGVLFTDAVDTLSKAHPEWETEIRAYDTRWNEMVPSAIEGTVRLLESLRKAGVPTYAITNFGADKFALTQKRFPFLRDFLGIVVSGSEFLLKPDPAIYRLLLERYDLRASDCLFIDDVQANVEGARKVGMHAIQFLNPERLATDLQKYGLLRASALTL